MVLSVPWRLTPIPGQAMGQSRCLNIDHIIPAQKALSRGGGLTKTSSRVPYDVLLRFVRLAKFGRGGALGIFVAEEIGTPGGAGFDLGAERDRPVYPGTAGVGGDCAVAGGFPFDSRSSIVTGPDRAASDPGSGAWLCERRFVASLFALG